MSVSKVWVPSKSQAWEVAEVINAKEDELTVKYSEGEMTIAKSKTHRTDPTHFEDTDDLCSMNHLHEAPLLDVLRRRFAANSIYTTTGDVLISVNPYKSIPGLYDNIHAFLDVPEDGDIDPVASKPHVFKIANYALQALLCGGRVKDANAFRNQSIVVSGESGAGKTEASKHVMSFLIAADLEVNATGNDEVSEISQRIGVAIGHVLWESNIIFEAFGNAKTVRNDNSSRFGKYIKLQYSEDKRIISAFTETFLLEKSRLVNISANERNYHIFYQLLRGNRNAELTSKLNLSTPDKFKMLCDANGVANTSNEDNNFNELTEALTALGCSESELTNLWTILACILHMSNIVCIQNSDKEGSVTIQSPSLPVSQLTELLGVSEEFFESRLTTQRVKVSSRSSVTMKMLKPADVSNNILALIKWMYSGVFNWLVKKVNYAHCSVAAELPNSRAVNFIGILDIFGFEILQTNSFEQLCINFTNERLQQQFNEYVFDREQEIYRAEGLDWTTINYKDNQHVIDLIGKKPTGLLNILEEQGMLNRGAADEGALLSSFTQTHDKKSAAYEKSRFTNDGKFIVKHFAGDVTYIVTGFLEKNNDSLQDDLMELMVGSTNQFIQNAIVSITNPDLAVPCDAGSPGFIGEINPNMIVASAGVSAASAEPAKKAPGKKLATLVTVSYQFRLQLDVLLVTLRATSLHYIKCIKPNTLKVPGTFDSNMVLEQLRYSGALEVVRIRQEGFPIAMPFVQFYATFEILNFKRGWKASTECSETEAKEYSRVLASEVLTNLDFQVGHTKVFLRSLAYENMHKSIGVFLGKKVRRFQALVRGKKALGRFRVFIKGLRALQTFARMFPKRKQYKIKMAAILEARRKEEARLKEIARLAAIAAEEERRIAAETERLRQLQLAEERRLAILALEEAERVRAEAEEAERQRLEAIRLAEEARIEAERKAAEELAEKQRLSEEAFKARVLALHNACSDGDYESVRSLLNANPADFNERNPSNHNCSVFHSALLSGSLDVVCYMNPTIDDLNVKDDLGNAAVHYAAMAKHPNKIEMFRFLSEVVEPPADGGSLTVGEKHSRVRPDIDVAAAGAARMTKRWVSMRQVVVETESSLDSSPLLKNTNTATGAANGTVLRAGWLSKRGEGPAWLKRWVVLTNDSLMYFRNDKDKVHRDSISFAKRNDINIERNPTKATAIDIILGHSSVKKNRSRISLMADTEVEIQEWMNLLKAAAGVESKSLRTSSVGDAVRTVSPALRQALFSLTNAHKENILHLIIKSGGDVHETLLAAAWAVDNGCPINGHDHKGLSPIHLACLAELSALAVYFATRGADPGSGIAGAAGSRNSLEMTNSLVLQGKLKDAFFNFKRKEGSFSVAPPRLRGFHYLSLHFLKHFILSSDHFISSAQVPNVALHVSVYNNNNLLVENVQICRGPVMNEDSNSQLLLWLDTFHLQVPLDNIGDESYIVIELKRGGSDELIAWTTYIIDKSELNSEVIHLTMNAPPKVLSPHPTGVTVSPSNSSVEIEVVISKRTGKETKMFTGL